MEEMKMQTMHIVTETMEDYQIRKAADSEPNRFLVKLIKRAEE